MQSMWSYRGQLARTHCEEGCKARYQRQGSRGRPVEALHYLPAGKLCTGSCSTDIKPRTTQTAHTTQIAQQHGPDMLT
jgi:hypothetical protein